MRSQEKIHGYEERQKDSVDYDHRYDAFLSKLRPEIIELNQCMFFLTDVEFKQKWLQSICSAWRLDLERMDQAESFTGEDIDCLLELKCVVPDVSNARVREILIKVLNKCSNLMLDDRTGMSVEKIMTLIAWRTELGYMYKLSSWTHQHIACDVYQRTCQIARPPAPMFQHAPFQVVGHACAECSPGFAGQYMDGKLFHDRCTVMNSRLRALLSGEIRERWSKVLQALELNG